MFPATATAPGPISGIDRGATRVGSDLGTAWIMPLQPLPLPLPLQICGSSCPCPCSYVADTADPPPNPDDSPPPTPRDPQPDTTDEPQGSSSDDESQKPADIQIMAAAAAVGPPPMHTPSLDAPRRGLRKRTPSQRRQEMTPIRPGYPRTFYQLH
jgi:hypothetical protein